LEEGRKKKKKKP